MLASNLFYGVLAAVATAVTAQTTTLSTTTATSTMTKTITITACNPTATNCPGHTTSTSSTIIPSSAFNLTSAMPTPSKNSTGYVQPTLSPKTTTAILTSTTSVPQAAATSAPPTGAGSSVFMQSGLMLGVLAAGIAILA